MSYYNPDAGALSNGTSFTRQLSTRDLSLTIPVSFVTSASISLTPACFASQRYDESAAIRCFSNLLAVGFRRFEIDVYWDVSRLVWSLCPVELGRNGTSANSTATLVVSQSGSSTTDVIFGPTSIQTDSIGLQRRQGDATGTPATTAVAISSVSSHPLTTATSGLPPYLTQGPTTVAILPQVSPHSPVIEVGPYACSTSLDLDVYLQVLAEYLAATATDIRATLQYFILNLHAAAPASDPTGSPQQPLSKDLPNQNSTISQLLSYNISASMYTPPELASDRSDLNQSWLAGSRGFEVDTSYFTINTQDSPATSPNGWPCESYIEMDLAKRVLIGIGRIDPQMRDYNISSEADYIFLDGYLQADRAITVSSQGYVSNGCFYKNNTYAISSVNSSWAYAEQSSVGSSEESVIVQTLAEASNATSCGISPFLNSTLGNVTADEDYLPYLDYAQSTIWSWAPGACQTNNEPYEWSISQQSTNYENADLTCPAGTTFDTPRTSLQNNYLYHRWRAFYSAEQDPDDELLWVNFNDLDQSSCWVIGQNTTCPYVQADHSDRDIVVPVVASVVVFVVAALTLFVKCAANRRRSKRGRRRGSDGWDYEGVPS